MRLENFFAVLEASDSPDPLAVECAELRDRLREEFGTARRRASTWLPRPCPPSRRRRRRVA